MDSVVQDVTDTAKNTLMNLNPFHSFAVKGLAMCFQNELLMYMLIMLMACVG